MNQKFIVKINEGLKNAQKKFSDLIPRNVDPYRKTDKISPEKTKFNCAQ